MENVFTLPNIDATRPLIIINPLGHSELDIEKTALHWSNVCGWFSLSTDRNLSARDVIEKWYQFPHHDANVGVTIDEDGIMYFEDDPPQIPLLKIQRFDEVVYGYAYDFIAIVGPFATYVTRID